MVESFMRERVGLEKDRRTITSSDGALLTERRNGLRAEAETIKNVVSVVTHRRRRSRGRALSIDTDGPGKHADRMSALRTLKRRQPPGVRDKRVLERLADIQDGCYRHGATE